MNKILLVIFTFSFIVLPLAKETCCSDTTNQASVFCNDHKTANSHANGFPHTSYCGKNCCLFIAKVQTEKSFIIISDFMRFESKYYLHLSKVKNVQVKLLRPPISPLV